MSRLLLPAAKNAVNYIVDTDEQLEAAMRHFYAFLTERGYYDECDAPYHADAKAGDFAAIQHALTMSQGECGVDWEFATTTDLCPQPGPEQSVTQLRILDHARPDDGLPVYYLVNTAKQLEAAMRLLFQQHQDAGFYDDIEPYYPEYKPAKAGDVAAIEALLKDRQQSGYEAWKIITAIDPCTL
jgi:hypothetical protein